MISCIFYGSISTGTVRVQGQQINDPGPGHQFPLSAASGGIATFQTQSELTACFRNGKERNAGQQYSNGRILTAADRLVCEALMRTREPMYTVLCYLNIHVSVRHHRASMTSSLYSTAPKKRTRTFYCTCISRYDTSVLVSYQ